MMRLFETLAIVALAATALACNVALINQVR